MRLKLEAAVAAAKLIVKCSSRIGGRTVAAERLMVMDETET